MRRTLHARRASTADRQHSARAALTRANATTDRINAELRFRDRLPDHAPHRPHHRGPLPDWVADSHALAHPDTPAHWTTHLAERHRILARALADRGHTLAAAPPAWARPLGPPPPTSTPADATHGPPPPLWWNCGAPATPPPTPPGPGPRPTDPGDAEAWDALDARIRALTGRRRPMHLPPPGTPASVLIEAALGHLSTP
ncbi:hypothetical protein ACFQ60_48160, partial [Streptomyces zhihengii]